MYFSSILSRQKSAMSCNPFYVILIYLYPLNIIREKRLWVDGEITRFGGRTSQGELE